MTGIGEDLCKDLRAEDPSIHHVAHLSLGRPLERRASSGNDVKETLAHILKAVGRFEVERSSARGVDEITLEDFVGPTNLGAPAFEHVLLAGVVLGVRIEIKIGAHARFEDLGIQSPQPVQRRLGAQGFELSALDQGKADHLAQDQLQILPVEKLGLFDVVGAQEQTAQPLSQGRLGGFHPCVEADQRGGEHQQSGVLTPPLALGGQLLQRGR